MEKEIIKPVKKTTGWDSSPSIIFFKEIGTKTIQSLRALLSLDTETKQITTKAEVSRGTSTSQTIAAHPTHIITSWDARKDISPTIKESAIDLSDSLLEEYEDENVSSGIRRDVIAKMTLRDQPILDQYQDEIFRLPLDKRLMILGAPGTGKTTTLIHRLGQKLHADLLTADEQQLVKEIELKFKNTHSTNWLMFTPTELLKHYLKESFSRANVPAPDTNVQVWDNFRRVLARDKRFKVLRDTRKGSGFVLNDEIQNIRDETFAKTIEWYEDFYAWQRHKYSIEIRTQFEQMINDMDYSMILDSNNLAKSIVTEKWTRFVGEKNQTFATCVSWLKTRSIHLANLREKLDNMTTPYDKSPLKDAIKINLLLAKINRIAKTFNKAVHDKVIDLTDGEKTRINNKAVDDKSTNISDEGKNDKEKPKIILQIISIASIFDSPIKYYLNGIPKRYKSFRLQRQKESKWYKSEMTDTNDIHPIEVDIVLLAILRTVRNWTKSKWNDIQ